MASNRQAAQNQHYVPKFILRNFLIDGRKEKVAAFSKRTGEVFTPFHAGYRALDVLTDADLSKAFYAYDGLFLFARKAMREMAILNVASVLDADRWATGMIRLVAETRRDVPGLESLCVDLDNRLAAHRPTYERACYVRHRIIAHRSRVLTYKEVHDEANLTDDALAEAIEAWLAAAQALSLELRGEPWRGGPDAGEAASRLLRDIAARLV